MPAPALRNLGPSSARRSTRNQDICTQVLHNRVGVQPRSGALRPATGPGRLCKARWAAGPNRRVPGGCAGLEREGTHGFCWYRQVSEVHRERAVGRVGPGSVLRSRRVCPEQCSLCCPPTRPPGHPRHPATPPAGPTRHSRACACRISTLAAAGSLWKQRFRNFRPGKPRWAGLRSDPGLCFRGAGDARPATSVRRRLGDACGASP